MTILDTLPSARSIRRDTGPQAVIYALMRGTVEVPQLSMGQLITNALGEAGLGVGSDLYHASDRRLAEALNAYIDRHKGAQSSATRAAIAGSIQMQGG